MMMIVMMHCLIFIFERSINGLEKIFFKFMDSDASFTDYTCTVSVELGNILVSINLAVPYSTEFNLSFLTNWLDIVFFFENSHRYVYAGGINLSYNYENQTEIITKYSKRLL